MRGDDEIIALLNEQLTSELTAINQYFLHAKMQQNWGLTKLAAYTRSESIDEMRHAELHHRPHPVPRRACPTTSGCSRCGSARPSASSCSPTSPSSWRSSSGCGPGITMCREKGDITTANLFEDILADEEHHIDYLETNLELIDRLGEQLYLAQLVDQPPTPG